MNEITVSQAILAQLTALQGPLPDYLARQDLANLSVLLRHTLRGCWAFALYNSAPVREEVVGALKALLHPLPVYDVILSPQNPDPLAYLDHIPPAARASRAIIFFYDLERAGDAAWRALNYNREVFVEHPHGLVFWITTAGRIRAAKDARHFWAQRSGVFDFTIAQPARLAELRTDWAGKALRVESYEDALRQLRLNQGLLDEYLAEGQPSPETLNDLYSKVARLLNFVDRREEAIVYLQDQLALAERMNDRRTQARALIDLAQVQAIHTGRDAAIDLLRQALQLADEDSIRADALTELAQHLVYRGESEQSLTLLTEALRIAKDYSPVLQANVLQAIGDVQQFRDERDAALESYAQALALFRSVG
ncbi:MAG: tetratricopeptide repeat protein, partial [Chloroflexota bacterium]